MKPAATKSSSTIPSIDSAGALAATGAHTIDLRSPSEYAEDHLPGAVNHPLFGDAERELIGTLYKQVSAEAAYEKAATLVDEGIGELVSGIAKAVGKAQPEGEVEAVARAITGDGFGAITRGVEVTPAEELPEAPVIVHCWRAGLRSLSVAVLLRGLGWEEVLILEGGYKAYRRHVIDSLNEATPPEAFVLRGLTGVGKTLVLRELERLRPGWTLDLEGHAKHRSSILGMVGLEPVGQKAFESGIATRLRQGFPADLVVYEGESRKIGDRIVPERIWESLVAGKNLKLTTTVERRVEALREDYLASEGSTEELLKRLPFIEERLGPVKWKGVLTGLLKDDRVDELVEALLEHYYDPLYQHSEKGREHDASIDSRDPTACAEEVAAWIESARG
jgi:tRNA 2-selenouridine synthase